MKKLLALILTLILCISVFAACSPENGNDEESSGTPSVTDEGLVSAVDYVHQMYKDLPEQTAASYDLITKIIIGDTSYTVTWTVSDEKITVVPTEGKENSVTVVIPKTNAEIAYVLTATVSDAEGNTLKKEYNKIVPAFKVNTIEEYYAAEKDDLVVFEGIVTGIVSKSQDATNNCIFLQDKAGKGGCYVYGMTNDPIADLNIEIGMTVRAAGVKDIYNGTHELKPTGVEIVSTEKTPVTPIDLTAAYTNAADLEAAELVDVQGALVTVKGVEITGQDADNGYYKFKLGELESYVRISGSTCAINKADQATFKATHTEKRGFKADVTGIVSIYNGAFYLVPVTVDAFSNFTEITRTDAEKVELEAGNLNLSTEIKIDSEIDLPLTGAAYKDVIITWTSDNACAVIDPETGKLTITLPSAEQTVKIVATLTLGEVTKTVEFTVKVAAKPSVAPQIVDTPVVGTPYKFFLTQEKRGEILYLNGEMNGFYFATTTNHEEGVDVYLEETEGGYKFYFMKGEEKTYISVERAMGSDGKEHDNVVFNATTPSVWVWNAEHKTLTTVVGEDTFYLGTYNNYNTISASKIDKAATSFVAHLAVMVDASSVSDADKIAAEKELIVVETSMTTELTLPTVGVTYPDVKITWTATGANATIVDGKLTAVQTGEEQTITLVATITSGSTSETKEFTVTVGAVDTTNYGTKENPLTVSQIIETTKDYAVDFVSLQKFFVKGTVKSIGRTGNYYSNVYITDGEKEFLIYSINMGDGISGFAVGDVIVAEGYVKNYKGTIEMTSNKVGDTTVYVYAVAVTPHTCQYPTEGLTAVCTICGVAKTHNCADGTTADCKCDLCGEAIACVDADKNCKCDVCGTVIECVDADANGVCDVCGAALVKYTYTKVEDAASIVVGDKIILTCDESKTQFIGFEDGKSYGISGTYEEAPTGDAFILEVVAGSATGSVAFKTSDGKYLAWTSGNSLTTSAEITDNSSWTITITEGAADIMLVAKDGTNDRVLRYNASSPRFACYKSGQKAPQIYKATVQA